MLEKDYKGQVDWWLCRLRNKTGMVPANYLEVYHQHTPKTESFVKRDAAEMDGRGDYAQPKPSQSHRPISAAKSTSPPVPHLHSTGIPLHELETKYADYDFPKSSFVSKACENEDIYDLPPEEDPTNRDYDLPPNEGHVNTHEIYDRPPSNKSSHSALSNRVSAASVGSSQLYDLPPTSPSALYDTPPAELRSDTPIAREDGKTSRRSSGEGLDLSKMYENEADEFLSKSKDEIQKEFDNLWQCVYGNSAYWGSDNKTRRRETVERTITAAKSFERALSKLAEFSKGVITSLENSSTKDMNFKKKCVTANTVLINHRQDVRSKIELLLEAEDTNVTAVVKSLLEVSRTSPQATQALFILVQANKALLFKPSKTPEVPLPILTKTEVKNRPLPEIPQVSRYGKVFSHEDFDDDDADYDIADEPQPQSRGENGVCNDWSKKRTPQDELPPLPFQTLRKPSSKKQPPRKPDMDYDDIDGGAEDARANSRNDLRVNNQMHVRNHLLRQSSGSNHSNSSDGGTVSPRRSRSPVHHSNPYGYIRTGSPQQHLQQVDRELLARYSQQMELLVPGLKEAIEVVLASIRNNDIPRVFVTKSKLAVVAAYKLVYIADSLHPKLQHADTKQEIVTVSNQLTETIKELVTNTKTAALQYPHVGSKDNMLVSVRRLFPSALDLLNSVKSTS